MKQLSFPVRLSILVVIVVNLVFMLSLKHWQRQDRVLVSDVAGYYSYLPAIFIHKDLDLEFYDQVENKFEPKEYFTVQTEDGKYVIKYTSGLAILYSPFFLISELITEFTEYPNDGYNPINKVLIQLSAFFYLFLGLIFLAKNLNEYGFKDRIIAFTIIAIGLGTNLFYYSSRSGQMPHVYNFFLFSIFLYNIPKWFNRPSFKNTLIMGVIFGFITLLRPNNGLIVLILILYGVTSFRDLGNNVMFFFKKFKMILLMVTATVLVWVPQLLYWKYISGSYLFYSYGEEGFYFHDPHIIDGLFSFRKGWLVYSPLMAFSLLGLLFIKKHLKNIKVGMILFVIINIYVVLSWWCWWYGGSFGQRAFVESYALLAIPFASFWEKLFHKKTLRIIGGLLTLCFIFLNIFQTKQFDSSIIHHDSMSKKLYTEHFMAMEKIDNYDFYTDPVEWDRLKYKYLFFSGSRDLYLRSKLNNKFLCTEENSWLFATKDNGEWIERIKFEPIEVEGIEYSFVRLYSYKNHPLRIEQIGESEYYCLKENELEADTFKLIWHNDRELSFMTSNNKYLSVDPEYLSIRELPEYSFRPNERFEIHLAY